MNIPLVRRRSEFAIRSALASWLAKDALASRGQRDRRNTVAAATEQVGCSL